MWLKKSWLTWILAWCSPPILTPWTEGLRYRGLPSTPSTAWSPLGRWWTRRGSGGWSPTPSYCCSAGPSTWARSWGWTAPCSRTLLFSRSSFLIYVSCLLDRRFSVKYPSSDAVTRPTESIWANSKRNWHQRCPASAWHRRWGGLFGLVRRWWRIPRTDGGCRGDTPSVRPLAPEISAGRGMPEWKSDELTITVSHVFKLLHISTEATSSSCMKLTSIYDWIFLFYE